jgi:HCOMODA/2-hydroxy-3-carboxy-muconic semialdehyde decarboxylase
MNERVQAAIGELVMANRILGNEGVVDAFGHISIRHPENAGRYFLAYSRSPGLVTEADIVEFDIDSNRLDGTNRAIYAERFIHGCLYRARPDVMSVCHSHAHAVVPFAVTNTPIEPIWVMASGGGPNVPNWISATSSRTKPLCWWSMTRPDGPWRRRSALSACACCAATAR